MYVYIATPTHVILLTHMSHPPRALAKPRSRRSKGTVTWK